PRQSGPPVAPKQRKAEDVEKAAVRIHEFRLIEQLFAISYYPVIFGHAHRRLHFREYPSERRRHLRTREISPPRVRAPVKTLFHDHPRYPRPIDLEIVIAQLMTDKKGDEQTAR